MQDGGRWEANGSVLPLTREWIEILTAQKSELIDKRSPSYEGVDWNIIFIPLRCRRRRVLPLTREWIEIL